MHGGEGQLPGVPVPALHAGQVGASWPGLGLHWDTLHISRDAGLTAVNIQTDEGMLTNDYQWQ